MVDPKDKILSKDEDDDKSIQSSHVNGVSRSCTDCHTTRTPLWRGGPAGPKSLCNACGIRYRKKRRAIMGLHKVREDKTTEKKNSLNGVCKAKEGNAFKLRLMALGREMGLKRKQRRKLGEEEQAAILLMALSSSSVYT